MWEKLQAVRERRDAIERELADPAVSTDPARLQTLAREHASLQPIVQLLDDWRQADSELEQAREMLTESDDPELRELAQAETGRI